MGLLFCIVLLCLVVSPVYGQALSTNMCENTLNCRLYGNYNKDANGDYIWGCEVATSEDYPLQCPSGSEMKKTTAPTQQSAVCGLVGQGWFLLTCEQCSAGKFAKGYTYCKHVTQHGYYQCPTDNPTCTDCPAGQVAAQPGTANCRKCDAGFYWTNSITPCTSCAPGMHRTYPMLSQEKGGENEEDYDTSPCVNCQLGFFQEGGGQAHCVECPLGKKSTEPYDLWYVSLSGSLLMKSFF